MVDGEVGRRRRREVGPTCLLPPPSLFDSLLLDRSIVLSCKVLEQQIQLVNDQLRVAAASPESGFNIRPPFSLPPDFTRLSQLPKIHLESESNLYTFSPRIKLGLRGFVGSNDVDSTFFFHPFKLIRIFAHSTTSRSFNLSFLDIIRTK
jgi:hypothetical protein